MTIDGIWASQSLSPAQKLILLAIAHDHGNTQGDLVRICNVNSKTMITHLESLVSRGFLTRAWHWDAARERPRWRYDLA